MPATIAQEVCPPALAELRVGSPDRAAARAGDSSVHATPQPSPASTAHALLLGSLVRMAAVLAYVVGLAALVVWPPLTALVFLVTCPFDPNRVVTNRFYRLLPVIWSRSFPFWRIRITGRQPGERGPYVVVSNHQSFLDVFVLSNVSRDWKWVAKKELFTIPLFGWGLSLTGAISLERGDTASAKAVMDKSRRYLSSGLSVMMFPEGTRSVDGHLLPFKPGAFKLAIQTAVPVLPIAVSGSAEGMPRGTPWIRPATITVRILEPVPTDTLHGPDARRLRDDVRNRIARALETEPRAAG